jgi:hypothetical protein
MDLDRFINVLANRISEIIPDGFHVTATDGMLWYSADSGRFPGQMGNYHVGPTGTKIRSSFGVYGASDEENMVGVAVQALDELQDFISEATHNPWPGVTSQPKPHGRIRDSHLDLWYGDSTNPILAFKPILLTLGG